MNVSPFDDDAVTYLATNKNLRVLPLSAETVFSKEELRLCLGHLLVQDADDTLFAKLDVTDRTQAAVLALRYGLVSRS